MVVIWSTVFPRMVTEVPKNFGCPKAASTKRGRIQFEDEHNNTTALSWRMHPDEHVCDSHAAHYYLCFID